MDKQLSRGAAIIIALVFCILQNAYEVNAANSSEKQSKQFVSNCSVAGPHLTNQIDWFLSKAVYNAIPHNNVLSTISLKLVLAMLYMGASGNTAQEFEKVLSFSRKDLEHYRGILSDLEHDNEEYELNIGTRMFLDHSFAANPRYIKDLNTYFNSTVERVNFRKSEATLKKINDWSKAVTRGKLQNLVTKGDTNDATIMLLVNAIFFKGNWETPFPSPATKPGMFTLSNGMKVEAPFMQVVNSFGYLNVPDLQIEIIRLPYMGKKHSMFVFLPYNNTGLKKFVENLNPELMYNYLSKIKVENIAVRMPKFHFESTIIFAPILKALGLKELFTSAADFRNIGQGIPGNNIKVSNILQKAGLDVNEQGSTLFAATQAELGTRIQDPLAASVNADRPFAFAILDEIGCQISFMGKVENPAFEGEPVVSVPAETYSQAVESIFPPQPTPLSSERPSDDAHHAERFEYFDTEFLQKLNQLSPGNVVVSPESVKSALAMILEGSKGSTQKQLKQALRLPENKEYLEKLLDKRQLALKKKSPNVTLEFQSKIFLRNNEKLNPQYLEIIQKRYTSNVDLVDFSNPNKVSADVNMWVNSATKGLIPELITPADIGADTKMLLANCIYFKGEWLQEFDVAKTQEECFYSDDDSCQMSYMMHTKANLKYAHINTLNADVVEIPFKDPNYVMIIVLPEKKGLELLLRDLPHHTLPKLMAELRAVDVELALPRFTIDFTSSLVKTLELVGIKELFSARANLTGILLDNAPLAVSDVIHKAKIEVTEKGAKAAAATGASVIMLSIPYTVPMKADHPFVFFIHEKQTGGNLFEGILNIPELVKHPSAPSSGPAQSVGLRGSFEDQQTLPSVYPQQFYPTYQAQSWRIPVRQGPNRPYRRFDN